MTFRIVLITDAAFGDDVVLRCVNKVAEALPPGALVVQLRDKRRAGPSLRLFATQLRRMTREAGMGLVVNGRPEVARDVGADGVHIGGDGGSVEGALAVVGRRAWVSVPAHTDDDVRLAIDAGVDAVLVSPIFPTRPAGVSSGTSAASGAGKVARGVDALRVARSLAGRRVQVFALGGITAESARVCAAAGADGVAVIRGLLEHPSPGRAARAMHDAMTSHW